jgi:hypothetical protein
MSSFQPISAERTDILRAKHIYGFWFGAVLGLTFSIFAWGVDSYLLSHMNSLHPWLKFVAGLIPCMLVGGLAGWLSAKFGKPAIAVLVWAVAALTFAWLTVMLPLQIAPRLMVLLEPQMQGLLHYEYYAGFVSRVGIAFVWIGIFVSIAGLLQLPLSDGAVFATSFFGKIVPLLVGLFLMSISGTIIDGLNNELLRSPIDALDSAIQFSIDHQGKQVDLAEARKMHVGALRVVQNSITPERKLIVSGYDQYLSEVYVLVKFQSDWVECQVFYNQPLNCEKVSATVQ